MRLGIALLVVVLVGFCTPTGAAQAGGPAEADRQLEFSRIELGQGNYDRALHSAESALRLDPARYEAILLKARAYEGMGNLELAEVLVLAYGEFVGGIDDRPDAQMILNRLRDAQEATKRRPRDRVDRLRMRVESIPLTLDTPQRLDVGPYRERVVAALSEGRCNAAAGAATELTVAAPDVADGWKLAGDAARCHGDLLGALARYRRYEREGGDEPSTIALIERLGAKFGTLTVRVDAPREAAPIRARLTLNDEDLLAEPTREGSLRMRDIPSGEAATLTVSGRGLRPLEIEVAALEAGETRELDVRPEWLGLATVTIGNHDDATSVVLLTEDAEVLAEEGGSYQISAASAWALVENEFGVQSVPLSLEPDAELRFEPLAYLPARLAVAGVPAGATVTLEVGTADHPQSKGGVYVLPYDVGEIETQTGVRIAPVRHFDSLPGSAGTLRVEHPMLGEGDIEVVLEAGTLNAITFNHRSLPGVKLVSERYAEWQGTQTQVRVRKGRTTAGGVVSGIVAAVGGGLLVGALASQGEADAARSRAIAAADPIDSAALGEAVGTHLAARERSRALGISAGIALGLGGVGLTVTFVSGGVVTKRAKAIGAWRPELVDGP